MSDPQKNESPIRGRYYGLGENIKTQANNAYMQNSCGMAKKNKINYLK